MYPLPKEVESAFAAALLGKDVAFADGAEVGCGGEFPLVKNTGRPIAANKRRIVNEILWDKYIDSEGSYRKLRITLRE